MAEQWIKNVSDKLKKKGTKAATKGKPPSKRKLAESAKKSGALGRRAKVASNMKSK